MAQSTVFNLSSFFLVFCCVRVLLWGFVVVFGQFLVDFVFAWFGGSRDRIIVYGVQWLCGVRVCCCKFVVVSLQISVFYNAVASQFVLA